MQTIEFEACLKNGVIHLPTLYQDWQEGRQIKVILLADENNVKTAKPKKKSSINRHAGKITLTQESLEFQNNMRDEWV